MTREIRVHTGTTTNGRGEKQPCAWVKTVLTLEPEPGDLVNGLGSEFFRNESMDESHYPDTRPESLPESLSQRQILAIYREEFSRYGENALWTWADSIGEARFNHAWKWLTELVVGAFPEMKEYVR